MKKIKFDSSVEWLRPFIELSTDFISLRKVKRIRGFRCHLDKIERLDGQTIHNDDGEIVITIRTHDQRVRSMGNGMSETYEHVPRAMYDILVTFAHELAHLAEWEHTPHHMALEATLCKRFAKELGRLGVLDTTKGADKIAKQPRRSCGRKRHPKRQVR